MSHFTVTHAEPGRCRIEHNLNHATVLTDLPPEYGGQGRGFSSTDMVAAALGSCYLSSIDVILSREGYDLQKVKVLVSKQLAENPKRISAISLILQMTEPISGQLKTKLYRAIAGCPVKRSLSSEIDICFEIHTT